MISAAQLAASGATAYAQRGLDGLADTWHPDVVYEEDPRWPGAGTFRGREAAMARFREYEEQLGETRTEVEQVVDRDDGAVIVWRMHGVTPGAEVPYEHRWAWVVQIRDGKAVHIRAYFDPEEALR